MYLNRLIAFLWLEVAHRVQGYNFIIQNLFSDNLCTSAKGDLPLYPTDVCMRSQSDPSKYQKVTGCSITHVLVDLYTDSECTNLDNTGVQLRALTCQLDSFLNLYSKINCVGVDYQNFVYEERFADSACANFQEPAFVVTGVCHSLEVPSSNKAYVQYTCTGGSHTLAEFYFAGTPCTLSESTYTHTGEPCQLTNPFTYYSQRSGCGTTSAIPSAAVGSDPVARFGDKAVDFELPPDVLTPLLSTDDLMIAGSVFSGGPWEQWFNRIVLSPLPENDRFLEIKMKEDLHLLNYSKFPRNSFRTIEVQVKIGNLSNPTFITQLTGKGQEISTPLLGYHVVFRTVDRRAALSFPTIGNFPSECAEVAGPKLHVVICSVPASEYYGHQRDLSMKYAHLDMAFWELRDPSTLSGLFPEMWGMHPMSNATKAYLKQQPPGEKEFVL